MSKLEHPPFEGLGQALKFFRHEKGWALADLSDATDRLGARVFPSRLSEYERGEKNPELATLNRILMALEIPLEELSLVMRRVRGEGAGERRASEIVAALGRHAGMKLAPEEREAMIAEKRRIDQLTRLMRRVYEIFPDDPSDENASTAAPQNDSAANRE